MVLFEYLDITGLSRFKSKIDTLLSNKVDKVTGKQLSSEDYTAAEKLKLYSIEAGAQVNAVTSVNGQTGDVVVQGGGGSSDEKEYTVTISADGKTITEVSGNDTTVTVFNNNGTITETYPSGDSYITTFSNDGKTITKTKVTQSS